MDGDHACHVASFRFAQFDTVVNNGIARVTKTQCKLFIQDSLHNEETRHKTRPLQVRGPTQPYSPTRQGVDYEPLV